MPIRILLAIAVRSAEFYRTKWVDVHLDGAQWHIPKSKTGAAPEARRHWAVVLLAIESARFEAQG